MCGYFKKKGNEDLLFVVILFKCIPSRECIRSHWVCTSNDWNLGITFFYLQIDCFEKLAFTFVFDEQSWKETLAILLHVLFYNFFDNAQLNMTCSFMFISLDQPVIRTKMIAL